MDSPAAATVVDPVSEELTSVLLVVVIAAVYFAIAVVVDNVTIVILIDEAALCILHCTCFVVAVPPQEALAQALAESIVASGGTLLFMSVWIPTESKPSAPPVETLQTTLATDVSGINILLGLVHVSPLIYGEVSVEDPVH